VFTLSASTRELLSHPIEEKKHSLICHLLEVGKKSREIFSESNFKNSEIAFYSGLLHDVGKANPFYQILFNEKTNRVSLEEDLQKKYVKQHSIFSAWATEKLLKKSELDLQTIDKILVLIYGHHSKIRKMLGQTDKSELMKNSQKDMVPNLEKLQLQTSSMVEFTKLNWSNLTQKFPRPMEFDVILESTPKDSIHDYMETSYAFSCLLQADRGSFEEWENEKFDLDIQTSSLVTATRLGYLREKFQKEAMENYDDSVPVSIVNAPTGIGKTKLFLDLITKFGKDESIERVFYFSPLLALTEDFENKLESAIPLKAHRDEVLYYNHLFAGSIEDKKDFENGKRQQSGWIFLNESFNKKFVITTTQRLLITIYSNKARDKLKLASFRNSILIIDEIQTIPKFILSNLKKILLEMNKSMGTRTILVSATIPHELSDLKKIKISEGAISDYLSQTLKQVSRGTLDIAKIPKRRTLVMANTRRKAVTLYSQVAAMHTDVKAIYLSSGTRKKDRIRIIGNLPREEKFILVSTQVVEAGVDISFSDIFREVAPLDNIIQVMGRLNREGAEPDAKLIVYSTDNEPMPYSPLEFNESWSRLDGIANSKQLYDILPQYYEEVFTRNNRNIGNTATLEDEIMSLDFEKIWDFIRKNVSLDDDRDNAFVPDIDKWDETRQILASNLKKESYKQLGYLTATLPMSLDRIGREFFDSELLDMGILLPKKELLSEIYDKNMGFDKWLLTK